MAWLTRSAAGSKRSTKKTLLVTVLATIFLAACTTTEQAQQALDSKWIGKSADDFVAQYGVPQAQYARQDGNTIFAWGSHSSVYMPGTSTTYGTTNSGTNSVNAYTSTSGGYSIPVECSIQLTVSKDHTIVKIDILEDTWGMWQTSRCNELFN